MKNSSAANTSTNYSRSLNNINDNNTYDNGNDNHDNIYNSLMEQP